MKTKQAIRAEIAAQRKALNPQWRAFASKLVSANVQRIDAFQAAETVALYMTIGGEVKIGALFPICWNLGKRTCIPVFNAKAKRYEMAEVTANTPYRTGHYGIREPITPALVPIHQIDLMAVPGVAFDRVGNRLGRGGGYYDRLLDGFSGHAAAVAFDFQIVPHVPTDAHDRPVHSITTETRISYI